MNPLLGMAALALSGMFSGAALQEAKSFESVKGYRIEGPAGWSTASGQLSEEEKARLPEALRKQYDPKSTDVMFMEDAKPGSSEFRDNLNVVVVDEVVAVNEQSVAELKPILTGNYGKVFERFEFLGMGVRTLENGPRVIEFRANYRLLGHDLFLHQMLLAGEKRTLIVTITVKRTGTEAGTRLLEKAVSSIKWTP